MGLPIVEGARCLPDFFDAAVRRHAKRAALRFEGQTWSYDALGAAVRRAARGLAGAGVCKGARVGLWMANRPEWVVAAFAVTRVGGVLVPINTYATPEERDYILKHSDTSTLLLQRSLLKHRFLEDLLRDHPAIASASPGRVRCQALPQLRRVFCLGVDALCGGVEPWEDLETHGVMSARLSATRWRRRSTPRTMP